MTVSKKPQQRAALPLDFTLHNKDKESVLFSMGGQQNLHVEIVNTSRAVMTLPAAKPDEKPSPKNHLFALGFSPGTLKDPEKIALLKEDEKSWVLHVGEKPERDNKRYIYLLRKKGEKAEKLLKPSEVARLTMTGVVADDHGGSHGTVVALRYRGLSLAGSTGELNGVAARHLGVMHHYAADLGRLDELIEKTPKTLAGLIEEDDTKKQALVEIRDEILPPLTVEVVGGWNLLTQGDKTKLTLRLRPNRHFLLDSNLEIELTKESKLQLYSDDPVLKVNDLQVLTKKGIKASSWEKLLGTTQDVGADLGARPTRLQKLSATHPTPQVPDYKDVKVTLSDTGEPRLTTLRLLCEGVDMVRNDGTREPFADFTLKVPLQVGPHRVVGDTMALSGQLGLSGGGKPAKDAEGNVKGEYPLRLFEDDGWNFTLEDDDKSGFRVGPADAKSAREMTHFVATKGGVDIGSSTDAHENYLTIRASATKRAGLKLMNSDHEWILQSGMVSDPSPAKRAKVEGLVKEGIELAKYAHAMKRPWQNDTEELLNYLRDLTRLSKVMGLKDRMVLDSIVGESATVNYDEAGIRAALTGLLLVGIHPNVPQGVSLLQNERCRLHVDKVTGHIGIGTTEPEQALHVSGDAKVDGNIIGALDGKNIKDSSIALEKLMKSVHDALPPVGAILPYGGTSPPDGWKLCNGQKLSRSKYNTLYNAIGKAFGAPDNKHFNLPDLRGRFIRGTDADSKNDPDRKHRKISNKGGNKGDRIGSLQQSATLKHSHATKVQFKSRGDRGSFQNVVHNIGEMHKGVKGQWVWSPHTQEPSGKEESRPVNVYVNYIIKTG